MDPLSEVLSLLRPMSYSADGCGFEGELAIQWPKYAGIRCYALLAGECWLIVEGTRDPVRLQAGDCVVLPRGLPFRLTTDLSLPPMDIDVWRELRENNKPRVGGNTREPNGLTRFLARGHFALAGQCAKAVLGALPPIVHIRGEAERVQMRWALDCMGEELRTPRPGGSLIAQQLAYTILVHALRLYIANGAVGGASWLSALTDPQLHAAIAAIHDQPGHSWTLQTLARRVGMSRTAFALRFREVVGETAIEYLTRWRMLLAAERLTSSSDPIATIAASLGYESESSFGRAFRRMLGCSPRRFGRSGAGVELQAVRGVRLSAKPETP